MRPRLVGRQEVTPECSARRGLLDMDLRRLADCRSSQRLCRAAVRSM